MGNGSKSKAVHDAYLNLGMALRQAMQFQEAKSVLRRAAAQYPNSPAIHLALGLVALDLNRPRRAVREFESVRKVAPHLDREMKASVHLGLGTAYRVMKKHRRASSMFQKAIALGNDSPEVWFALIDSLVQQHRWEDVFEATDRASQRIPGDWQILGFRAEAARELGSLQDSLDTYNHAIEKSGDYHLHLGRAETLRLMNRVDEAISLLAPLADRIPGQASILLKQAELLCEARRLDEALPMFDRAAEMEPARSPAIRTLKAEILIREGRIGEAKQLLDQTITDTPGLAQARVFRALAYQEQGFFAEALADLDTAFQLGFEQTEFLVWRHGELQRLLGEYESAIQTLDEVLRSNPGNYFALASRGDCLRQMGQHLQAIEDFGRALDLSPGNPWILGRRGQAYLLLGQYDEAREDLSRAYEADPSLVWILSIRGELHMQCGRYDEARHDFHVATQADPTNDWYHYLQGLALKGMGDTSGAEESFLTAISLAEQYRHEHPSYHQNNFDFALYHLVVGRSGEAVALYRQFGSVPMNHHLLKEADAELSFLQTLFPGLRGVEEARHELQVLLSGHSSALI